MKEFYRHGTHVPVLSYIGDTFDIKIIVEFGLGVFSTPLFLDKIAFPYLDELRSYEAKRDWIKKMRAKYVDERHTIHRISNKAKKLTKYDYPSEIDLVFIDGESHHRPYCVQQFANSAKLLVVHDAPRRRRNHRLHSLRMGKDIKYQYIYAPPDRDAPCTVIFSNYINVQSMKDKIKWTTDFKKLGKKNKRGIL